MPPKLCLEQLEDRCVPAAIILNTNPTELGVFNNGTWTLDTNDNHVLDASDTTFVFGLPGDIPITGDWNAGGHTEVGVFRNVNGVGEFILDFNGDHKFDAGDKVFTFGLGSDTPVVGDWDGTGSDKVGIFRNDNGAGLFVLDTHGDEHFDSSSTVDHFGLGTDTPVIGDWNGSGTSKVGVFRNRGSGQFILDTNGDGKFDAGDQVFFYGLGTDTPVIGDWTGATRTTIGVVRNNGRNLEWVLDANDNFAFNPGDFVFTFGSVGEKPVVGQW
jgi:hypothetical protein